ncbi:MAG: hypothetical protein K8S87_07370 [Planctomycetes bacterium]|nr:hypothetical protein [Planctomycetota bacterium]
MLEIMFKKETYQFSRRFTTYLIRFLYILVIFIFIALIYSGQLGEDMSSSALETKLESFGRNLYYLIAWLQIILTVVLTPVIVCNAFVSETRENTLQLIQLTGLTDRSIVLGKILGKFLSLFLIILTGLPILFFAKLFGFIDFQLIIGNFFNSLSLMLITGGIAAFYGLTHSKLTTALYKTLTLLLIIQIVCLFIGLISTSFSIESNNFNYSQSIGMIISPILNQFMLSTSRGQEGIPQFLFYIIIFCELWVAFVIFWYYTLRAEREYRWWSLGLIAFSGISEKAQYDGQGSNNVNKKSQIFKKEPIAVFNPVKETESTTFNPKKLHDVCKILFPILISLIVVIWLAIATDKQGFSTIEQFLGGSKTIFTLFTIFSIIWVSVSLASEKENRTIDVLLSTPVSNLRIIKLALHNFWECTKYAFIALGIGLFLASLSTQLGFLQILLFIASFAIFLLFLIVMSLYFSATSATSVKAIIKSTILATVIIILPIILSELFILVDIDNIGAIIMIISPYKLFDAMAMSSGKEITMLKSISNYPWLLILSVVFAYAGVTAFYGNKMLSNLRYILQDDA